MKFEEISNRVIGCAIEVHRVLNPGLPESAYEQCLAHELKLNGIGFRCQQSLPNDMFSNSFVMKYDLEERSR